LICLSVLMHIAAAPSWGHPVPKNKTEPVVGASLGAGTVSGSAPVIVDEAETRVERLWNQRIDLYGYLGMIGMTHTPDDEADEVLLAKIAAQIKYSGRVCESDLSDLEKMRSEKGHLSAALACRHLLRLLAAARPDNKYVDPDLGKTDAADSPKMHGHVQVQRDPSPHSYGDGSADGEPQRGYVGLRVVNGLVNNAIQYSPSSFYKEIQCGDQVISVDDRPIAGLSATKVMEIIEGAAGTTAELKLKRGSSIFTVKMPRSRCIPEKLPTGLSARQYLELASQLRESCRFEEGKQALYKAQELDPKGRTGGLAKKMLLARYPQEEPSPLALWVYSNAFRLRMDGQFDMAEVVYKHCIKRWPRFELPYRQLASLYGANHQPQKAQQTIEQLLAINLNNARGWVELSDAQEQQGNHAAALKAAQKAVDLDPDDVHCAQWLHTITSKQASKNSKSKEKEHK
jgi:tetratricopeptide (TPR) repeat protein